ncbi:hypothetical protein Tco_1384778 [Tanacetum coccineum]
MDVSLPNSWLQADPHIKSRLKTLKGNFGAMHDMVLGSSTSGFSWDPDKCVSLITAPNDFSWDPLQGRLPISAEIVSDKGTKRKRSKTDEFIHIYSSTSDTLNNFINAIGKEMNINLSKMANDQERKLQYEIDLMKRVQKEIDALPGITFEEAFEATRDVLIFTKCPFPHR